MNSTVALLVAALQAYAASDRPNMPSPAAPEAPMVSRQESHSDPSGSNDPRRARCLWALRNARNIDDGESLSAFRTFNDYPPSKDKIALEDVDLTSRVVPMPGLSACVEDSHFPFSILIDGVLTEGTSSQMHPVTAWKAPQGYLAFFMHKNYETVDGEGETIEISALALDMSGRPIQPLPTVSSWYEYEGSIRIRDFVYSGHRFMTTEEIFDPLERDESGNVLSYEEDARSGTTSIHEIDWTPARK